MAPIFFLAASSFGATFANSADGNELQHPESVCLLQIGLNVSLLSGASEANSTKAEGHRVLSMQARKPEVQSGGNAPWRMPWKPASTKPVSKKWLPWTMTDCTYIAGLSKLKLAIICNVLALMLIFLCIPFLLMCS
eukprot:CAMPEP_0172689628 /NCGR_PEP_ID=MMETSP1074-20121228/23287_1 /TAXON_ID=2916 /ORGANISM="Ceratium fusus, Strain PA161109" /LENGTH=135 /DNA_ID=CAMNT_0013509461 /DNA_START=81 /DNA_END=485 /DNA_ORIENTATION=-